MQEIRGQHFYFFGAQVLLGVVRFAVVTLLYVHSSAQSTQHPHLRIFLNFLQLLSEVQFTSQTMTSLIKPLQLDVTRFISLQGSCAFDVSYLVSWLFTLFTPLFLGAMFLLFYGFVLLLRRLYNGSSAPPPSPQPAAATQPAVTPAGHSGSGGSGSDINVIIRTLTAIFMFSYILIITTASIPFACRGPISRPDGSEAFVLYFNPEIECDSPIHHTMIGVSVAYIVVIGLGIPLWIGYGIIRHLKGDTCCHTGCFGCIDAGGRGITIDFDFLTVPFQRPYKWFEGVILLRRLALVIVVQATIPQPLLQCALMSLVITIFAMIQSSVSPFTDRRSNNFELRCLFILSISYAAQCTFRAEDKAIQDMLVFIVVLNAGCVIWSLIYEQILAILWEECKKSRGSSASSSANKLST